MNHRESPWTRVVSFSILTLVACSTPSFAQAKAGAIAGKVTDSTGAVLSGAKVSVEPRTVTVDTNQQGQYFVNALAAGEYTVTVSYVGFADFAKTVEVAAGRTTSVDAMLQVQLQGETELVSAPRATGEAEALNTERTAPNVVQVLPAEVIRSLPNANMADALGRLPSVTLERDEGEGKYVQVRGTEPRLTNTTIDGINVPSPEPDVRQIKFDAIPADIVEKVEINKTLMANMDGDGIGGSVDLVTKTAVSRPTISFSSLGGYTPIINGRGLTEDTGTIGGRFGPHKQFGLLVGGSYDWNGRGIDDVEPVPDVATMANGSTTPWYDAMDIREYQYFRSRVGIAGSADDKIGAGSDVALRGMYADFKNYGDRWAYSLTDNTPGIQLLNPGNVGCGTDDSGTTVGPCGGTPGYSAQLRHPDIGIGSVSLQGRHALATTALSWDLSAGHSWYGEGGANSTKFSSSLDTSACQFDPAATTSGFLPQWSAGCYAEAYNPANWTVSRISKSLGDAGQTNLGAGGSAAKFYHAGSRSAQLEFGAKYRNEAKRSDTYSETLKPKTDLAMTLFPNRLVNNQYYKGGAYKLGYNASSEDVLAYAKANPSAFKATTTQGQDPSDYNLTEQVAAAYVMNTIDLSSRAKFIAGLRVESTRDRVRNFSVGAFPCPDSDGTCTSLNPNAFSGSYTTILPSVSFAFSPSPDNSLRLVYARGLSRPDPSDLAQALTWDTTGNGANRYSVSLGNANLKAETGDDIDVLFDHYMNPFGDVSVGYFYKHLQNPIITHTFLLTNFQPAGGPLGTYLATQPVNAGTAWVEGVEFSYLQHFPMLPGPLAGLGLSANYGYTASGASAIPGRSDHPRLERTSPNAFNVSPTYDRGPISLRVGLSYNEASIYGYQYEDGTPGGVTGPLSDIYFYSHVQVDAQGSVRVARQLNVVLSVLNMNNEVFGFYQGSPQYNIQREYYQPTFEAGLRWSVR